MINTYILFISTFFQYHTAYTTYYSLQLYSLEYISQYVNLKVTSLTHTNLLFATIYISLTHH